MSKRSRVTGLLIAALLGAGTLALLASRGGEDPGLPPGFLDAGGEQTAADLKAQLRNEGLDADVSCPELEAVVIGGGFVCLVTQGENQAEISVLFEKDSMSWIPTPNLAVPSKVRPRLDRDLAKFLDASAEEYEDLAQWDPSKPLPVGTVVGECPGAKARFVTQGDELWRCEILKDGTVLDSIALISMPRAPNGFVWVSDQIADEMIEAKDAELELMDTVEPVEPDLLPFTDARAAAQVLYDLAVTHSRSDVYNRGVDTVLLGAAPKLQLRQGVASDSTTISYTLGDDAQGVAHYVFAVKDTSGGCAGVDLTTTGEDPFRRGRVFEVRGKDCSAAAAMVQIGLTFPEE